MSAQEGSDGGDISAVALSLAMEMRNSLEHQMRELDRFMELVRWDHESGKDEQMQKIEKLKTMAQKIKTKLNALNEEQQKDETIQTATTTLQYLETKVADMERRLNRDPTQNFAHMKRQLQIQERILNEEWNRLTQRGVGLEIDRDGFRMEFIETMRIAVLGQEKITDYWSHVLGRSDEKIGTS